MEQLKHECGIALIRLLKPIEYYVEKYGTWQYGLNKLYLMLEKQHNRGQEGAGIGCVSAPAKPGTEYIFRERATGSGAIQEVFRIAHEQINKTPKNTP
ncbi:MAG: amidophosphoribosyltransferase, partial [Dysgonamonadaceae bacterium]|nr:amidophosphoribosyltransferase [Dysgonamonadaceae bacterium]